MRCDYSFHNICGAVYKQGNVLFAKSGKQLLSPIGNRVGQFDLAKGSATASSCYAGANIACMDLSEDGTLLVAIDNGGVGHFFNWPAQAVIERAKLHESDCCRISPCSRFLALASGTGVTVWATPPTRTAQYKTVTCLRNLSVCNGTVTSLRWAPCCKHLLIGAEDCAVRVVSLTKRPPSARRPGPKHVAVLAVHRCPIVDVFAADEHATTLLSVATDRVVCMWRLSDVPRGRPRKKADDDDEDDDEDEDEAPGKDNEEEEEEEEEEEAEAEAPAPAAAAAAGKQQQGKQQQGKQKGPAKDLVSNRWLVTRRMYMEHDAFVGACEFNRRKGMLFVGFKNGVFGVYMVEGPEGRDQKLSCIHTLSITEQRISSVAVSPDAEWVAFASARLGQLLVWEWRSETYILKQQSHYHDVQSVGFSPDGSLIASAGDDGKLKVWGGSTGFCFTTFRDHQGPIGEVRFSNNSTLWSASADGTVRGFDLKRYRCFRALTPPRQQQLGCVAIDPSGELIVAGGLSEHEILMWSAQTGQFLDAFPGHDAPVSSVDFHPSGLYFASGSWDSTARVWEVFARSGAGAKGKDTTAKLRSGQVLQMNSEVLCVRFSPDGSRLAALTLNGNVVLFSVEDPTDVAQVTTMAVSRDVRGGWIAGDTQNPWKRNHGRCFNTLDWSPDGSCFLLAGNSKWIALYSAERCFLLRKWAVTNNHSLMGQSDVYDWRAQHSELGNIKALDLADSDDEDRRRKLTRLPGAKRGDQGKRRGGGVIARSTCVRFSPTGREWAAATTDGVLVYSLDGGASQAFNPVLLQAGLTPQAVYGEVEKGNHAAALLKALNLGDPEVLSRVFYAVPPEEVDFAASQIPEDLLPHALELVAGELESRLHMELCLHWASILIQRHSGVLCRRAFHSAATQRHAEARRAEASLVAALQQLHKSVTRRTGDVVSLAEKNEHRIRYLLGAPRRGQSRTVAPSIAAEAAAPAPRQMGFTAAAAPAPGVPNGGAPGAVLSRPGRKRCIAVAEPGSPPQPQAQRRRTAEPDDAGEEAEEYEEGDEEDEEGEE
eukprot:TRINITY_DN3968_c0_g4_i1.p1 TRINITY_DN3968_c0_g4~~TRINITY_DN3968_c0_g4_i1.p1  ORF type:complete len:1050 (+),score=379.59 TRINITY_DN3968_c0_g4_i1:89-3238(+)